MCVSAIRNTLASAAAITTATFYGLVGTEVAGRRTIGCEVAVDEPINRAVVSKIIALME